jgi:hypothetical protein
MGTDPDADAERGARMSELAKESTAQIRTPMRSEAHG